MDRKSIANNINYKGNIGRTIVTDEKLTFKVGDEYKFYHEVESWSGENCTRDFIPEVDGKYVYFFFCKNGEGHEVDYDNEEECEILDAEGCNDEGEVLVKDTFRMKIVRVATDDDFKEMGYYGLDLERI